MFIFYLLTNQFECLFQLIREDKRAILIDMYEIMIKCWIKQCFPVVWFLENKLLIILIPVFYINSIICSSSQYSNVFNLPFSLEEGMVLSIPEDLWVLKTCLYDFHIAAWLLVFCNALDLSYSFALCVLSNQNALFAMDDSWILVRSWCYF